MGFRIATAKWALVLSGSLGLLAAACGDDEESLDTTVATVAVIRGGAQLGEGDASMPPIARAAVSQSVRVLGDGLARLSLDVGPELLLGSDSEVSVDAEGLVHLESGIAFADVLAGDQLELVTERGSLRLADAAASVRAGADGVVVYVVRGEVAFGAGEARGTARAGELLTLAGGSPEIEAATLWEDWTGGLARPGPGDDEAPSGVGTLEARVPDEIGLARWPLAVRRLDVRVRVEGDLAITEVDQEFFNPASETVEGLYRVRVPRAAVLQRFAVDREGRLVDGYVREKAQARQAYEAQVYRGSTDDPALLEWDAPGAYRARIYPIAPGETRRIVVRYAEWLSRPAPGAPRIYTYPMGGGARAPHVQELSITADLSRAAVAQVRAGLGAAVQGGAVELRLSDVRPRADFWLELVDDEPTEALVAQRAAHTPPQRAPGSRNITNEADERDYYYLPVVLPDRLFEAGEGDDAERGMDLVIVADVSAGTDGSHLELGRSVVESITAHLGARDRVAVVTSDLAIRSVEGDEAPALGPATPARLEVLLDGLGRVSAGGATDLGAAVAQAAELLDPARNGAVIYVGDGAPTVGELGAEGLLTRLSRLPAPLRFYAVGVGGTANLALLEALTRGGGLALRVEEQVGAAEAALELLAHASRPLAQRVEVDLGAGIENAFPRRPVDVVRGAVLQVAGRVREEPPTEVTVRGTIRGEPFEVELPVTTKQSPDGTDLRLRWAGERLRQQLLEGASREEVAELGTRYGLITPFTSYYVPSARELGQMGLAARVLFDKELQVDGITRRYGIKEPPPREDDGRRQRLGRAPAVALLPLALGACDELEDKVNEADGVIGDLAGAAEPTSSTETASTPAEIAAPDDDSVMAREQAQEESADMPMAEAEPAPDPSTVMPIQNEGEEGGMAAPEAARRPRRAPPTGGADNRYAIEGPADSEDTAEVLGALTRGGSGRAAAPGYGSGGDGRARGSRTGESNGFGGLGLRGQGRGGGGGAAGDGGEARDETGLEAGARSAGVLGVLGDERNADRDRWAARERSEATTGTVLDQLLDGDLSRANVASGFRRVDVTVRYSPQLHRVRRCSDAAGLMLDDRRALWTERLGNANNPAGWVDVYSQAKAKCEARTWRDRRALLRLILRQAGGVRPMIQVYRMLSDSGARSYLRAAILRRVRSPEDLRIVREAFGMSRRVDERLIAQVLERAGDGPGRIRALRQLIAQFPFGFDLRLRLLEELERQDRIAEAKRLARRLRQDPMADPGVRTAIGEMYLRVGDEAEARRVFSEIVEFAPLDELARRRLGDLYRAHGWYEDAYRQYQTLAEIRPDDPSVLLYLAQAAAGAGRIDEALRFEQSVAETAQPGMAGGVARAAILWSSVRFAKLRAEARAENDDDKLDALVARMRRSGVLREAGAFRATLTWSHPDAQLSLWGAHPQLGLSRPMDIIPEHGLEAFDVQEAEDGAYRIEVRRSPPAEGQAQTSVSGELVLVWNEGTPEEKVEVIPISFDAGGTLARAWTFTGQELRENQAEGWPEVRR